jgi:hypothetical protein
MALSVQDCPPPTKGICEKKPYFIKDVFTSGAFVLETG